MASSRIDRTTRSSPTNDGTATTEDSSTHVWSTSKKAMNKSHRKDSILRDVDKDVFNPNSRSVISRFSVPVEWADDSLTEKDISGGDAESIRKEKSFMIESIKWMGAHVPRCVLQNLTKESMMMGQKSDTTLSQMPIAETYRASLLFIDMSGFTKLSQMLDVESLSKNINSYFQKIIDEVVKYGGDVLKFAGDAIFAEWRLNDDFKSRNDDTFALQMCVHSAASCGAAVIAKCSDFPVFLSEDNGDNLQVTTLNVHCGLGFGEMAGVHVGNNSKRDYICFGDPIDQVSKACDLAKHGELMASPQAYEILQTLRASKRNLFTRQRVNDQPHLIASRKKCYFDDLQKKSSNKYRKNSYQFKSELSIPFHKMDVTSLRRLQNLVSLYVHPVVIADVKSRRDSGEADITHAQHRAEAEIRSVYTIFVKVLLERDSMSYDNETFQTLNDVLDVVVTVLGNFRAHFRQFIVDDKGIILIGTFGLRGSTFPKMASERVLPACRMIHYALQNDVGVDNYIGATLGKVYCGVVGSLSRHEFYVMGPSVNLAARLLFKSNHPGILIDDSMRKEAMEWGTFAAFPPMKAKGYNHLVPVFQPMAASETRWGKLNPHFVGRKKEIKQVCAVAREMAMSEGPCRMHFVWGESGSGKSDFLVQSVAIIRRAIFTSRRRLILARSVGNEGDVLIPFSALRSIFKDTLVESRSSENAAKRSKSHLMERIPSDTFLDNCSLESSFTFSTVNTNAADLLFDLCNELNAPKELMNLVGHHLLGLSFKKNVDSKDKLPKLDEMIDFMAQMFIQCTLHADLTIVALDDLQFIDNLSWKVILKVFEIGKNILFICGSRPYMFVKQGLVRDVKTSVGDRTRCKEITLLPLDRFDLAKLVAIVLDIDDSEIDITFLKNLYDHTNGMPDFAAQMLQTCKRKKMFERTEDGKVGVLNGVDECQQNFSSLRELMLQRIDSLDDFTRKTLHFASILGHNFNIREILGLSEQVLSISEAMKDDHCIKMEESLQIAVKEGILDDNAPRQSVNAEFLSLQHISASSFPNSENEEDDLLTHNSVVDEKNYQFCHDTWRQAILSLLLESYKKDIHMYAAKSIEMEIGPYEEADYHSKIKLFNHLKQSGNSNKATVLSLSIGEHFLSMNLSLHSIFIYNDALKMWRKHSLNDDDESFAGIPTHVINTLDSDNIISIVKLLTALGQALGTTLTRKEESARAFEDALEILKRSPSITELKDRSFIFPIYSGLFFLLKIGGIVANGNETEYEHDLVSNFVEETRLHGDPVHYSRSLAMQSEFYSRHGQYEEALKCHKKLKKVYNVKKHSALVVKSYNSDRSAQNFGFGANALYRLGKVKEALLLCDEIFDVLMPQMDLKNVHNSFIMIYPTLWILKNEGRSKKAVNVLQKYVIDPFYLHYGEHGKTVTRPLFRPTKSLFTIQMYLQGDIDELDEDIISWALEENSLRLSSSFNKAMTCYGRCCSSIGSEICLLLSKQINDEGTKRNLIAKGWNLAKDALKTALECGEHQTSYIDTKPIYDQLKGLTTTFLQK